MNFTPPRNEEARSISNSNNSESSSSPSPSSSSSSPSSFERGKRRKRKLGPKEKNKKRKSFGLQYRNYKGKKFLPKLRFPILAKVKSAQITVIYLPLKKGRNCAKYFGRWVTGQLKGLT